MPNFFVHWLAAEKCIKEAIGGSDDKDSPVAMILQGMRIYTKAAEQYKRSIINNLTKYIDKKDTFKAFRKKVDQGALDGVFDEVLEKGCPDRQWNPVICFSAYMLGACGPDFWTVPTMNPVLSTAGLHFDLGHYHRSQAQFKRAIWRWKIKGKSFQTRVEKCYLLGMASHIATDLVVHQLVNVSAGGYKFLKKQGIIPGKGPWENEQGWNPLNLWNAHNKAEHFWDSYVRYRYFGDFGPVFQIGKKDPNDPEEYIDEDDWFTPWKFPLTESLQRYFRDPKFKGEAKDDILSWLDSEKAKYWIEQCFILPRVACDKILGGSVDPFIYDIVVNKTDGAYPSDIIFQAAIKEADTKQMKDEKGIPSEKNKLKFFSSSANNCTDSPKKQHSHNYLCYFVCPDLEKVQLYGHNLFYDFTALKPFIDTAGSVGAKFVTDFMAAINRLDDTNSPSALDAMDIGSLDHFWNLDTGLGIDVFNVKSATDHEVITRLNFVHISDLMVQKGVLAARIVDDLDYDEYVSDFKYKGKPASRKPTKFAHNPTEGAFTPAFPTHYEEFADIDSVSEKDKKKYLEFIRLDPKKVNWKNNIITMDPKDFFNWKITLSDNAVIDTWTKRSRPENEIKHRDIKNRLTLQIETAIPSYGEKFTTHKKPGVGYYFLTSKEPTDKAFEHEEDRAAKWLNKGKPQTKAIDFVLTEKEQRFLVKTATGDHVTVSDHVKKDTERHASLYVFRSRLLLNLENRKDLTREIEKGKWNNVVPYNENKFAYSRNFAIGTGRKYVLYPIDADTFHPHKDFDYYENVSVTENIVFSLYIIVHNPVTGELYDALNKEPVKRSEIENIMKIDCMDFVKIVLFYCMDGTGAAQLNKCYVDGLLANVTPVDY